MADLRVGIDGILRESFSAAIDEMTLDALLARARMCEISAGRVFIDVSRPHRCGIMISGLARVYTRRGNGSQTTIRRVGPGAAVGVKAILGHRNTVAVQAITDVEFLELDRSVVLECGRRSPPLAWAIAEELSRRLDDTERHLESEIVGSVLQRVAGALLDFSGEGAPLVVELSQEALAEIIGSSRERVGHAVRQLAHRRLIEQRRGRLIILAPAELHGVARAEIFHETAAPNN